MSILKGLPLGSISSSDVLGWRSITKDNWIFVDRKTLEPLFHVTDQMLADLPPKDRKAMQGFIAQVTGYRFGDE